VTPAPSNIIGLDKAAVSRWYFFKSYCRKRSVMGNPTENPICANVRFGDIAPITGKAAVGPKSVANKSNPRWLLMAHSGLF
jgi:hypothetical protein